MSYIIKHDRFVDETFDTATDVGEAILQALNGGDILPDEVEELEFAKVIDLPSASASVSIHVDVTLD